MGHGIGTAWGWLEINIGDPRMRNGLKPPPFEYQYTEEGQTLHNKVLKIAQDKSFSWSYNILTALSFHFY